MREASLLAPRRVRGIVAGLRGPGHGQHCGSTRTSLWAVHTVVTRTLARAWFPLEDALCPMDEHADRCTSMTIFLGKKMRGSARLGSVLAGGPARWLCSTLDTWGQRSHNVRTPSTSGPPARLVTSDTTGTAESLGSNFHASSSNSGWAESNSGWAEGINPNFPSALRRQVSFKSRQSCGLLVSELGRALPKIRERSAQL